uniref:Uncharacterized protein n=1 Tax=Tetraselmis sp. GSL018 TaxID=582737 RepID=A0A061R3B4_9CHLO
MRRFAVLLVSDVLPDDSFASTGFWTKTCGNESDVWEYFQCFRGVVPQAEDIRGYAAVLVTGDAPTELGIQLSHREQVTSVLSRALKEYNTVLFATGAGCEVLMAAIDGTHGKIGFPRRQLDGSSVVATRELLAQPWAQLLPTAACELKPVLENLNTASRGSLPLHGPEKLPEHMGVLAAATGGGPPVCWNLGANALFVAVAASAPGTCREPPEPPPVFEPGGALGAGGLACVARAFVRGGGGGDGSPGPAAESVTGPSEAPGKGSAPEGEPSCSRRPNLETPQAAVTDACLQLVKAVRRRMDIEAQHKAQDVELAGGVAQTAADRYEDVCAQLKGLLAFADGLKEKWRLLAPAEEELGRIEEKVSRLETLVAKLDESAARLEQMSLEGR